MQCIAHLRHDGHHLVQACESQTNLKSLSRHLIRATHQLLLRQADFGLSTDVYALLNEHLNLLA